MTLPKMQKRDLRNGGSGNPSDRRLFTLHNLKHMGLGGVVVSLVWAGATISFNYKTGEVYIGPKHDQTENSQTTTPQLSSLEKMITENTNAIKNHVMLDTQSQCDFNTLLEERNKSINKRLDAVELAIRDLTTALQNQKH